jgi:RNase adapter protein RapZ
MKTKADVVIIVITGMSGSGKSVALRALEDTGFYCVDNLPVFLLPKLLEMSGSSKEFSRFALVMDIRGPDFLSDYEKALAQATESGYQIRTVFLDARDEIILRRFSETRRKHPRDHEGALLDSIAQERQDYDRIKGFADLVLDTSDCSVHELRDRMQEHFGPSGIRHPMNISLISFGFKHGLPSDASLVIDVRFLPNPFFIPELKDKTGLDKGVSDFVLKHEATKQFLEHYRKFLEFLLPYYKKEGKHYLTIGVGCTGGVHRSVAIVEALASALNPEELRLTVTHRELNRHRVYS